MKILVVGAAGTTGRLVVDQALQAGHDVTPWSTALTTSTSPGVTVRAGDAVYGTIEAAVTGQDAVINTVGGKTPHKNPTLETMVTTSIITAMQRRGVHRLVVTSLIGIGHSIANATPTS